MGRKLTVLSLVLLFKLILTGGCGWMQGADKDEEALKDAEAQRRELLQEIDRDYDEAEPHYRLGRLYQRDGLWDKARQEYNVTLRFDPVHRPAQAGIVKALIESGQQDRAQMRAEIYMDQASASAAASLRLAMAFENQELDSLAMDAYQQALELEPDSARIHKQLGYYYLARDNEDKAREHLRRSIRINSNQPEVANQLGKLGVSITRQRGEPTSERQLEEAADQAEQSQ